MSAERRRESIIEAAVEEFGATGYRAAKVSDIAARLGVSEPVIFQNFGSKPALFAAVLDRVAERTGAQLTGLLEHFGSVPDLLAHLLHPAHVARLHAPGNHGALFAEAVTLGNEPDLAEPARRAVRTVVRHLADLLRRGRADGTVRGDLDPEPAAWLLLSVMSAQPFRTRAMPAGHGLENAVVALTLRALLPEGRVAQAPDDPAGTR
jgi:AcrR family transcriptional regulator